SRGAGPAARGGGGGHDPGQHAAAAAAVRGAPRRAGRGLSEGDSAMSHETNRRDSLHPVRRPDLRGWTVVGADGRKIGEVRDLLADRHDDEVRFLDVELDQTALAQNLDTPGGAERITAGAYPADPNRPGATPQADVDPTVGESERNA